MVTVQESGNYKGMTPKKTQNFQVNKLLSSQRGQPVPQYALFDLSKDPAEKEQCRE